MTYVNIKCMDKNSNKTGWGKVANWYDKHLNEEDTYHSKVVAPNLLRLVDLKQNESLLELGCGQGFFTEKFFTISKDINGVDIGDQLINIAKRNNSEIKYLVGSADDETILNGQTFDVITVILALQNIKNLPAVSNNIARLLKENGRAYIVLNHPAFRIPQNSDWIYDDKKKIQARKIDAYLNQIEITIDMNPGEIRKGDKKFTKSFHRSLQDYSKSFAKNKLAITKIEEWISHKKSEDGPRAKAEDLARKEFPLFMCLELKKLK
jgi:ubiquinone/menaquinone biosynthesis C-methylase UbiE